MRSPALPLPVCLGMVAALVSGQAGAQRLPDIGIDRPLEEERLERPPFARPPPPLFELPPAPELGAPLPELPGAPKLDVQEFSFTGNTVFTAAELSSVARSFRAGRAELEAALSQLLEQQCEVPADQARLTRIAEGARGGPVTVATLLELRRVLTLLYVECGFISSGAVLPEQQLEDGVVRYLILEGRLTDVNVQSLGRLQPEYVRSRLMRDADQPFNINHFEDRFRLLLLDPAIARLNGEVGPGTEPGDTRLDVVVIPSEPVESAIFVDNHWPLSTGAIRGGADVSLVNLIGVGDVTSTRFVQSLGARELDFDFSVPVNSEDARLGAAIRFDSSTVVEEPLDDFDIDGDALSLEIGGSYPAYRTPTEELLLEATFARRRGETTLLDDPISLSPGVRDGVSNVSVLRLTQTWTNRGIDRVLAVRSTASIGLDILGATNNSDLPDSQFFAWLGQAQFARRFRSPDDDSGLGERAGQSAWLDHFCESGWRRWFCRAGPQVLVRADAQLAADPLLPLEQFPVGGADSVRGFPENELVRDNGAAFSIEARLPLIDAPLPPPLGGPGALPLQVAPFFDYGLGWNEGEDSKQIGSTGVGLVWDPGDWLSAEVYYAVPLINTVRSTRDQRIQFRIVVRPTASE